MGNALNEFVARVENLRTDILFISSAAAYRPQVHRALDYNSDQHVRALAEAFAAVSDSQASAIYGPLLVRLTASFERYLRSLMSESIAAWTSKAGSYGRLPEALRSRNVVLTGRLLASSEEPRDHMTVDVPRLITNLSSCAGARTDFVLNGDSFATLIGGVTPEVIDNGLKALRITECWDAVCADAAVKRVLQKSRTADAVKEAKRKLKELARRRNNWAHGGDEEVTLTESELGLECEFLISFVRSLDRVVFQRIEQARL